jgi:hypothetical protein
VTRLRVRDANRVQDKHALLSFRCTPGGVVAPDSNDDEREPDSAPHEDELWIREVEEYVRVFALRSASHVLIFESPGGDIAGVSAFDRVEVALSGRDREPAWRLQVIALSVQWQGKSVDADIEGCSATMKASEYILRSTFRRMLEIDKRRVIVVATVHDENRTSMAACARVGLVRTGREADPNYWAMLGEVDPAAGAL